MQLTLAFVNSDHQININELDLNNMSVTNKIIDSISLTDENINTLVYDETQELPTLSTQLEKEAKFYPITSMQALNLNSENWKYMAAADLLDLYNTVSKRWIMSNNINTIENLYPTITYLKDLWVRDRNSFFEELWFLLKTNLGTSNLNIIFHDLTEPNENQAQKGEKPKLCYSFVEGTKLPNLFEGKDKEAMLMKEYKKEFESGFHVTEYNRDRGQLVACAQINLSPILIMAELPSLNQLQRSVLKAIFTGLQ